MTMFDMVSEFHRTYGQEAPEKTRVLPANVLELRISLIMEELREYQAAAFDGDIDNIAKELADLVYVVIGTAVAHGIVRFDDVFAEVHRSNMSKLDDDGRPILREDGKVLKGPNYSPADIRSLLELP